MEKFRTFLKRSGALMSALVLLLCCTVPASAAVSSTVVSPILFDEIGILYGEAFERSYRFSWPGNIYGPVYPGDGFVQYRDIGNDGDNFTELQSVSKDSDGVAAHYYLTYDYTGWGVGFYNHSGFVLRTSDLTSGKYAVQFDSESLPVTGQVSISATVARITNSGGEYLVDYKTFTRNNWAFMTSGTDLLGHLNSMIDDYSYRSGDYVYISSLSVRFFFDDTEVIELGMHIDQHTLLGNPTVSDWVNQYDLSRDVVVNPVDPSGVNFVDWLSVAVGGFLDFQLWPGMSLNEIMWIILVVGVLFWFLKLTI